MMTIEFNEWKVNFFRRSVYNDYKEVRLTFTEFEVLMILIASRNSFVTRDLIVHVLKNNGINLINHSVDKVISNIRKKLGNELIHTIRNVGYEFVSEVKFNEDNPLAEHVIRWFNYRYKIN